MATHLEIREFSEKSGDKIFDERSQGKVKEIHENHPSQGKNSKIYIFFLICKKMLTFHI